MSGASNNRNVGNSSTQDEDNEDIFTEGKTNMAGKNNRVAHNNNTCDERAKRRATKKAEKEEHREWTNVKDDEKQKLMRLKRYQDDDGEL